MKPENTLMAELSWRPAAFRRLCVETRLNQEMFSDIIPAAFRRLCVETPRGRGWGKKHTPAAFRRLCVETLL